MKLRIARVAFAAAAIILAAAGLSLGAESEVRIGGKAAVEISFAAAGNSGALVKWSVSQGSNVIGYNVYRETQKGLKRVNPAMIPGSYVSTAVPGDYIFSFYDKTGMVGASYRIGTVEIGSSEHFSNLKVAGFDGSLVSPGFADSDVSMAQSPGLNVKNAPSGHYLSTSAGNLSEDLQTQQWVAAQSGVKIRVSDDGLFRVSRTDLQNAGFDVAAPASNWQLYFRGIQQAIVVPADGSYIEFFGKSLDTPESRQNVYFLIAGAGAGKRIGNRVIRPLRSPVLSKSFTSYFKRVNRFLYASTILNGPETNFFGEVISSTEANINFDLESFDAESTDAEMTVVLQGLTNGQHQTRVVINGTELSPVDGVNRTKATGVYSVPASALQETGNTLGLTALLSGDFSLLDSISVRYKRRYVASGDRLSLETDNYKSTEITGFSSNTVRVFDVSYPENPRVVQNAAVSEETKGSGTYAAVIPANRKHDLFAVSDNGLLQADSIEANSPSTLSSTANAANYLIITHPDFLSKANDWAAYRTGDGFQTMVADINDVFDEFGFGEPTAISINSFLQFADANWQVGPDYVLLIGDGSYDPQNFEGQGAFNLLPVLLVDTLYEETASDDSIADFNGDGLAEIAIGRIPARVPSDVTDALTKVTSFETTVDLAPARGSLCASDLPQGYDFAALCDRIHNELPPSIPLSTINRADANANAELVAAINSGKYVVNYSGHGSTGLWAHVSYFSISDVPSLTNSELSIFTMLTCLNGYFIRPVTDSLSEELLKTNAGGAVAVWSSSGSTTPDIQEIMAKRFFNQLGIPGDARLGDLINDAKGTIIGGSDVRRSWVLLGDPALKVKPLASSKASKAGF